MENNKLILPEGLPYPDTQDAKAIVDGINMAFGSGILPQANDWSAFLLALSNEVNRLIIEDFQKLIFILYRIDVEERKLKSLLEKNKDTRAGLNIAIALLQRQLEKQRTRKMERPWDTGRP